jgi:hypothetical protein
VVAGSFAHSKVSAKRNLARPGSGPHDYTQDFAGIQAPVLMLLNSCGRWPPFEKPAEWAARVLAFLRGY